MREGYSTCSVCVSVCLCVCVCFPYSGTSRDQAYKQRYQQLQRDTGMKYKKGFFFNIIIIIIIYYYYNKHHDRIVALRSTHGPNFEYQILTNVKDDPEH